MVQNLARLILNHLVISKVVKKLKTLFFLEICQTGPVTNSLHCSRFLNVTQRSRCVTSKKRLREEDDVTNLGGHGTLGTDRLLRPRGGGGFQKRVVLQN